MKDNKEIIGVIGAMDEEIKALLNAMEDVQEQERYRVTYYSGKLCDTPVVLCKSGVGKVNAAVCTQTLIDYFQVDAVLFTGVAGALHPDLDIGDIVVSTACQQHDIDASPVGFPRGTVPFQDVSIFPADEQLVAWAVEAGHSISGVKVLTGKVLSGDQFISDAGKVRELREQFDGACVEMEGAAVAHVCHLADVPYVVIRSMSDRADHTADVNFAEFTELASERSASMIQAILRLRMQK
ncbi:methylthioadenosine nucleosidase /adenosylhomocysteine nucleosidase [Laceyella tengchongensis]|uniref:adenosylhomocysteine nucleosidase n=1 Tax=Laceyella tengchongensis TaxID=574699 RepID=A0AA46AEQ4_9BACL|nr:5'-methylthioadenosine/adenosylhomocysteine nucleosidase [Laceyella tengchongensis]SMP14677.1 methylthioadenosine nucleosidase /adenosylhomocysteine nucleosidase [Laceyella tengchongensis]